MFVSKETEPITYQKASSLFSAKKDK